MARKEITAKRLARRQSIKKTLSLLASLSGIPSSGKDQRGFAAEEKALAAAQFWKRKKIIREVRKTKRLSSEDRDMKDLVLTLLHGKEVMVQVKNYYDYLVVKKCRDQEILPFIIWHDEDESIARERMLSLILGAYASDLPPSQLRGVVAKMAKLANPPARRSLTEKVHSFFRGVS